MSQPRTASHLSRAAVMPEEDNAKAVDPRNWYLPVTLVVSICAVAVFLTMREQKMVARLERMEGLIMEVKETMLTPARFEKWTYKTEKMNAAGGAWTAADLPE